MLPKILVIIAASTGLACLIATGWLVHENWTAKNLVFAATALLAAAIGTALNAFYELQPPPILKKVFAANYTVDRSKQLFAQYKYPLGERLYTRPEFESVTGTNAVLVGMGDPVPLPELSADLATVSFIQFLLTKFPGWGGTEVYLEGLGGRIWSAQPAKHCDQINLRQVQSHLEAAGNLFANAPFWQNNSACLPPGTKVIVERNRISMKDRLGSITFSAEDFLGLNNRVPEDESGQNQTPMSDGRSVRYSTVATKLSICAKVNWGYSKNQIIPEYQAWQESIVLGAVKWFEVFPSGRDAPKLFISPFRSDGVQVKSMDHP